MSSMCLGYEQGSQPPAENGLGQDRSEGQHHRMTLVYLVQRLPAVVDDRLRERLNWAGGERFDDFLARWARTEQDRACQPPGGDSSRQAAVTDATRLSLIASVTHLAEPGDCQPE